MNAPTRFMLAAFVTICLVGVVIGVSVVGRASPGLVVSLQQLRTPAGVTPAAQFAVSNSDSRIMYVIYAAPQIRSNGRWNSWTDADYHPFFCLLPGGAVTNVIVSIPHPGNDVRVPFQWGWWKRPSPIQRIAPRLTTRFSNLMITLRTSQSLRGWNDPYGGLPEFTRFYYITNAEPTGPANRSQPIRSETSSTPVATGSRR
jgi:hypothetical protein